MHYVQRVKKEATPMISSIASAASAQPPASVNATTGNNKQTSGAKQSSSTAETDTVHLSSAAQAQVSAPKAALQEAAETPAQTAKEAAGGDIQARRLLAREAEAAQSREYSPTTMKGQ
jgi:hypothetical protein